MAMQVAAALAEAQFQPLAGGEAFERRPRLGDERPRILTAPAKRWLRGLRSDQPHGAAVGELERLAVDDRRDGGKLGLG